MNATKALERIEVAAASPKTETRDATKLPIGDGVRQGDVYLWRMPMPKELTTQPTGERQVAVGTTTGARHVVEGDVTVYREDVGRLPNWTDEILLGPVLIVGSEQATLTHPEHAHVTLGEGCWQVSYQLDARTRRAVRD
jgi:hypothetical protein